MDVDQSYSNRENDGEGGNAIKRACNECRTRKIRCNKESPCSNCQVANRPCTTSEPGLRPKEPRSRVLISSQYERKIDHFEDRLASIEGMLRDLTASLTGLRPPTVEGNTQPAPSPATVRGSTPHAVSGSDHVESAEIDETEISSDDHDDAPSTFEGDSSMAAQTAYATEFLHDAVSRTSVHHPGIQSALQSLQQIAAMQNRETARESRFEHVVPLPRGGFRELPMPPQAFVVDLLRGLKERPPRSFTLTWICAMSTDVFSERTAAVYFPATDYSLHTFAMVNGALYFLIQERAWFEEGDRRAELLQYQAICRANLETALVHLPLLMPPRKESVEVLLLASAYAVEMSKFTLAWRFNITAATICQTLGYHRQPQPQTDAATSDITAALFWFVYAFDKAFSLRFGRNATIQDYDITVPRTLGPTISVPDPAWRAVFSQWITHAEFIGKAYEQLFSPAALTRPPEQRAASATGLIHMLDAMMQRMRSERQAAGLDVDSVDDTDGGDQGPFSVQMSVASDDVMFYSAKTLVYRAIPNHDGHAGSMCVDAARMAFKRHHDCMRIAGDDLVRSGYIHWTILYVPFVPVIVLFCHVIETSSLEDLQRLSDFADSLQPLCSTSKATKRFYGVCQVLYNVARLYIETKAKQDEDLNLVGNGMDIYLSQLGFMPHLDMSAHPDATFADTSMGLDMRQTAELGNWFSGNRHVLGLVDDDMVDFDPVMWTLGGS